MAITRKEFIEATFTGAAALALFAACGGDDAAKADAAPAGPDAAPANCPANGVDSKGTDIVGNHGHELTIPVADIAAASMDRTYSIQGTANHDHMVTITAADFDKLKANMDGFMETSTAFADGHSHVVTVRCV